ncbi:MAG: hypothetical protein M1817_006426 [Caeruleum heppii]|nr:MAG: hypothetical protein M1817_006426 [Caeruleum heppii]
MVDVDFQSQPIPSSLAEVELLVGRLYSPLSPSQVAQDQETLQWLQRSPDGWQLADALLQSPDDKVRFFGALTFTVKLNSDWETLDAAAAQSLLQRLLSWLAHLIRKAEGSLVVKKLCSTLVVYFIRFSSQWLRCLRHVLSCLVEERFVAADEATLAANHSSLLPQLTATQAATALYFSSALVEEVGKTDANSIKHQHFHDKVAQNVDDAVSLMRCFQAWVSYSHRAFLDAAPGLGPLTQLTQLVIGCLGEEALFESTVEVLTDILINYGMFLRPEDSQVLRSFLVSEQARERIDRLKSGDNDFDLIMFGRLLLAFADARVQDLAREPERSDCQRIMQMLHDLLRGEGYAVADDEMCVAAVEFWTSYVEFMTDALFDPPPDKLPWSPLAREHLVRAIEEYWAKIRIPGPQNTASWDQEVRRGFKEFRKDIGDLLQSSYPILGVQILQTFGNLAIKSLESQCWQDLEAAVYCINALSDAISEGQAEDEALSGLFGSNLFVALSAPGNDVPERTRQSVVHALGDYATFFERHIVFLPAALNFLFHSLASASLAANASRSVFSLCSSCRKALTSELPAFLLQYGQVDRTADTMVKERVLGGVASIVQALDRDEEKLKFLHQLLEFVRRDVSACLLSLSEGLVRVAEEKGLSALRSLASIGKGLQEPDDVLIDLEAGAAAKPFWQDGPGADARAEIWRMVEMVYDQMLDALPSDGDLVEAACSIFKAGFTETAPGPFLFGPEITTTFLLKSKVDTPRLGLLLAAAGSLVSSHSTDSSSRIDGQASALLKHVTSFVHQLGDPRNDPEIAHSCIDFVARLLPRYVDILLTLQPPHTLEAIFAFTLKSLTSQDPLPKRSAAQFWASLLMIDVRSVSASSNMSELLDRLGPPLAEALIFNIGGNGSRSDLDAIAEPLKKMIFKHAGSRAWLEAALAQPSFSSAKVNETEKRLFLQRLMSLRGARPTNSLIRDFWLMCRGTEFAYTS